MKGLRIWTTCTTSHLHMCCGVCTTSWCLYTPQHTAKKHGMHYSRCARQLQQVILSALQKIEWSERWCSRGVYMHGQVQSQPLTAPHHSFCQNNDVTVQCAMVSEKNCSPGLLTNDQVIAALEWPMLDSLAQAARQAYAETPRQSQLRPWC